MPKYNPIIILVAPQMGENIGAAARAMKNFGLTELRIVSPRDGWPNEKAEAMAVGGVDIIKKALIYDNLLAAIGDMDYVYATTAMPRDMNKNYVSVKRLQTDYPTVHSKVGIMFGRENCGLTNDEITLANKIITINTDKDFSSLNLAQAVVIVCHEIFVEGEAQIFDNNQDLCTKEQLGYFYQHLFDELNAKNFFRTADKKDHMIRNIRNIFGRLDKLSKNEIQTLRGIVRTLSNTL